MICFVSVLQREEACLAFKEFGEVRLVFKIELMGDFGDVEVGVYQQPFYFEDLFGFNDLARCFPGKLFDDLCQVVGSDGQQVGILFNRKVFVGIFFHQMIKAFGQ